VLNSLSAEKLLFLYQDQPDNTVPHMTVVCYVNYLNTYIQ